MTTEKTEINQEKYPIHFRLSELKNSIDAIGKFLHWYEEQGGELIDGADRLINEHFQIDPVAQQHELEDMTRENAEALNSESDGITSDSGPKQTPIKVNIIIQSVGPLELIRDAFSDFPADHLKIGPNGNIVNQWCLFYTPPATVRTLEAVYKVIKAAKIVVLQEQFI